MYSLADQKILMSYVTGCNESAIRAKVPDHKIIEDIKFICHLDAQTNLYRVFLTDMRVVK
jgi:hypothetical protein